MTERRFDKLVHTYFNNGSITKAKDVGFVLRMAKLKVDSKRTTNFSVIYRKKIKRWEIQSTNCPQSIFVLEETRLDRAVERVITEFIDAIRNGLRI